MMNARRLLLFNIVFWLLAAGVLFVNSWPKAQSHIDVAYVRYAYFFVVGLLLSGALMRIYESGWFVRQDRRLLWIILFSAAAALVTAFLINPITYMMVGHDIHTVPVEILSTGTLYFALLFVIWSALYLQLRGQQLLHPPLAGKDGPRPPPVFQVEKRGKIRQLRADDILCIRASGDYVDLVTSTNIYLKKATMRSLEALLDPDRFKRIHRSTIVNVDKIESVSPKPGGSFDITLEGGHQVRSSRGYRAIVKSIVPSG